MSKYVCRECHKDFEYVDEKCRVVNTRAHCTIPLYCPYCGHKNLLMDITFYGEI